MLEFIGIVTTVIAVVGVLFNHNYNKCCFSLWLVSNSLSAFIHLCDQRYSLVLRDLIFFVLAVHGLYKWSKYQQFFKEKHKWANHKY